MIKRVATSEYKILSLESESQLKITESKTKRKADPPCWCCCTPMERVITVNERRGPTYSPAESIESVCLKRTIACLLRKPPQLH